MGLNAYTKPKKSLLSRNVEEKSAQTTHSLKRKRQQQLLLPLLNPNSGKHLMGKCLMGKSLGKYLRANVLSANVELPYSSNLKTCNLTKCALFVLGLYTVCHSVTVSHASYMRHGLSSLKIGCRKQEIALLVQTFCFRPTEKHVLTPLKLTSNSVTSHKSQVSKITSVTSVTVCHSVSQYVTLLAILHASYMRHGLSSLKIGCRKQEIALLVHADFLLSVDSKELFDPSKASMTQLMTIIFVTCVMWSQV
jgi:hypothetical protein